MDGCAWVDAGGYGWTRADAGGCGRTRANAGGCDRVWDGLMEGWLGGQIGGSMDRWVWYMGVCVWLVGYILEHLFWWLCLALLRDDPGLPFCSTLSAPALLVPCHCAVIRTVPPRYSSSW